MRPIDADALSIRVMDASYYDNADEDVIWNLVQDAPTIDAVPVVRCKDCCCHDSQGHMGSYVCNEVHYCSKLKFGTKDDEYCSFGERKNNG